MYAGRRGEGPSPQQMASCPSLEAGRGAAGAISLSNSPRAPHTKAPLPLSHIKMGCNQSTVKDQVVTDTVPAESAPVSQVTAEEVAVVAAEEVVVEEAPVFADETLVEPTPAEPVADKGPAAETTETSEGEEVAAAVEALAVEEPAVAVEAPAEKEPVAAVEIPAEEEPVAAVEVSVEEISAVEEPVVEAEPVDNQITEESPAPVEEPVAETKPAAPVHALKFESTGVTTGDKGVVFYNFKAVDSEDPAKEITVSKRYNDFKALHADIATAYPALPALPKASPPLFKSRANSKLTEEREAKFLEILNAIASHPSAAESSKFQAFLA